MKRFLRSSQNTFPVFKTHRVWGREKDEHLKLTSVANFFLMSRFSEFGKSTELLVFFLFSVFTAYLLLHLARIHFLVNPPLPTYWKCAPRWHWRVPWDKIHPEGAAERRLVSLSMSCQPLRVASRLNGIIRRRKVWKLFSEHSDEGLMRFLDLFLVTRGP